MDNFTIAFCVATCVIICTIFGTIRKFGQWRHLRKQVSKFPGPPTLPIIGNAHLFAGSAESILDRFIQLGKSYPAPYRLWIGNWLLIVVNTPDQIKVVCNSPKTMDKGPFYGFVRPWLGTGLLTASAKWRVHRKLIQPTFSPKILQSFVKVFSARSMTMAKEMERNLDGPEFDINIYTSQCALHAICETSMGVNLGPGTNGDYYAETIEKVTAGVCKRVVSPWLHPNFIFQYTRLGKDQKESIKFLHDFTDNVIQKKKKELMEQRDGRLAVGDNEEDVSNWVPQKKALLDHLIDISNDPKILSDEALREEVDTIMAAGADTIAITSSYVMLMLASHPEVQEKVCQELREIFEENGSEVTSEHLTRMPYLERVIKETMRLFPIAPLLERLVTDDLHLGEHTLPAGSIVGISILELHRNGDIWPDPLKFDPDRFLPEEAAKRASYTYLPFSGGPRKCLGSTYAMMSMKTLLATVLRRYQLKKDDIKPVKDLRFKWEFLLRPVNPITLKIERRTCEVSTL